MAKRGRASEGLSPHYSTLLMPVQSLCNATDSTQEILCHSRVYDFRDEGDDLASRAGAPGFYGSHCLASALLRKPDAE
jgi:hypothetical protein